MIQTETYTINGVQFIRTYSDANRYIVRDGEEYEEACDPAEYSRTYVEGREIVSEPADPSDIEAKAEGYDILMGVSE